MIKKGKQKLMKIAEVVHLKFFGHPMSDTMREFLGNLSWSFFGGIIAAGIMFVVQILAAKWLGPEEFGKYNALLSFATAFSFFFLLGSDIGSVRFLSDKEYKKEQKDILATTLFIVSIQILIVGVILFLIKDIAIKYFSVGKIFVTLGFFWAVINAYKSIFDGYFRSLALIKRQSIIRIISALLVGGFFVLTYIFCGETSYIFYVYAMIFGTLSFIFIGGILAFRDIGKIKWQNIKLLFGYNKFVIIVSVGGFLMGLEKLLIGKFIGITELGVYSAYFAASFFVINILGGIFLNIFWPQLIAQKDAIPVVIKKLIIIFKWIIIPWVVLDTIFIFLYMHFLGVQYSFELGMAIAFSVVAFFSFVTGVYFSILNIDYIKITAIGSLIVATGNIMLIYISENITMYMVYRIFFYVIIIIGMIFWNKLFLKKADDVC